MILYPLALLSLLNQPWVTTTLTQEIGGALNCTPVLTHLCLCDWLHRYYHSQQCRRICSARFNWQQVKVRRRASSIEPQKNHSTELIGNNAPHATIFQAPLLFAGWNSSSLPLWDNKTTRFIAGINLAGGKLKSCWQLEIETVWVCHDWRGGGGGLCPSATSIKGLRSVTAGNGRMQRYGELSFFSSTVTFCQSSASLVFVWVPDSVDP